MASGKSNPTLQDIAERCGVSKMTVSLALRDDPRISEATKERVRAAADALGHRKNPYVATLMAQLRTGRKRGGSPVIAFLNLNDPPEALHATNAGRNYYFGARERAAELGFALDEFALNAPEMSYKRMERIFRARNIHAVLLAPAEGRQTRLPLRWERYAVAKFGFTVDHPASHLVTSDHFQTVQLLVSELLERGYRHMGLALPRSMDERVDHRWIGSFLYHKWRLGRSAKLTVEVQNAWRESDFLRWFRRERPEVVIGFDPRVPEWLARAGFSVPGDVGYASMDWSRDFPEQSGVNPRPRLTGALAIDLLVEQIHRNEWGEPRDAKSVLVTGEWVEGKTLKEAT